MFSFSNVLYSQQNQTICEELDLLSTNDTTICGDTITITANPGFENYYWSTGSDSLSITISLPDTYTITTSYSTNNNLVANSYFSQGNTGFYSAYNYSESNLYPEENYSIITNANDVHSDFEGTGNGNFMVVNGSTASETEVWCQNINTEPETSYNFSTLVTTVANGNLAQLEFSINGETIGSSFSAPSSVGTWSEFGADWYSTNEVTAEICIINENMSVTGNDFGLDNISFTKICTYSDSIHVTIEETESFIIGPQYICENESPIELVGGPGIGTWQGGLVNTNTYLFDPSSTEIGLNYISYTPNGFCMEESTHEINVYEVVAPETSLYHEICFGDAANLNTGDIEFLEYNWSTNETSSNINVLSNGIYHVGLTDFNTCSQEIEFEVVYKYDCEHIVMPNVFTPNNDFTNDLFTPILYEYVPHSVIKIYNKWGLQVYYSQSIKDGWNGKHFSKDCLEGVYYWVIEYQTNRGTHKIQSGIVSLLR